MERCLSPEAKKSLNWSREDILLWNVNVHYRFHKSLPLVAIPKMTSPTVITYLCNVNLNGIFRLRSGPPPPPPPPAVRSLQIIRSNFLSIFRLPDTCHMFFPLSMISSTAGWAYTGRARLFGATRNRIPASVSQTKRENQGKIKPTPTEMSSDEDIVVPVPWGWLLSADARS